MPRIDTVRTTSPQAATLMALAAGGLLAFRWLVPERGRLSTGWSAVSDSAFAIGLVGVVAVLAVALGRRAIRMVRLSKLVDGGEGLAIEASLGLGFTAFTFLLLGLAGLFHPAALTGSVLLLGWLAWPELGALAYDSARLPHRVAAEARQGGFLGMGVTMIGLAILLLSALEALTPPTENDALMYHLQAPRLFLEVGHLFPMPEVWQANGPLQTEMLYALGLAFGTDTFARLIHLLFTVLLVVATYGAAAREMGARGGWFSVAVLVGIPILPIWGSLALTDMAWALYSFLAVLAVMRWTSDGHKGRLAIGGLLAGFAIGSKYLGLGIGLLLVGWIAISQRQSGIRRRFASILLFSTCAAAVAGPWFLKNLVWTGNPVYPFFLGGPGWTPERLSALMTYLRSFGAGTGVAKALLLPLNVYVRHAEFGTIMTSIDIPSPLFVLALASPWVKPPPGWRSLAILSLVAAMTWAIGSQQIRFLLPLYPLLTLLSVATLLWIDKRSQRRGLRVVLPALAIGLLAATLAYQVLYAASTRPIPVVLGLESKASFLRRSLYDYSAMEFIDGELATDARVALLWDGRGYYCSDRCLPDADLTRWPRLIREVGSGHAAVKVLQAQGISHILVDLEELANSLRRDRGVTQPDSVTELGRALQPPLAREVFRAERVVIYELSRTDK